MENIVEFNKLGKLKYASEFIVHGESKKIVKGAVINADTYDSFEFIMGEELLEFDFNIEDRNPFYNCKVQFTKRDDTGDIIANLRLGNISDLVNINTIIQAKYYGELNNTIITKDSKDVEIGQDVNTFTYRLPVFEGKFTIDISTDINNKIVVNDYFADIIKNEETISRIITGKNNYIYIDFGDTEINMDDFVKIHGGFRTQDGNVVPIGFEGYNTAKEVISYQLTNISSHFSEVQYDQTFTKIEYDEYGIPMDDSNHDVRYEKYYDEDDPKFLDSIISLHPLYFDVFDPYLNGMKNIWVIDQIVFSEVDKESNLIFYSREVRELSVEENNKLIDSIYSASDKEPMLVFLDLEQYHQDFKESGDRASIVNILGSEWINHTNLFKKENNFDELNQFEEIVNRSIDKCFIDYFYRVATDYKHSDRDPEYIDEVFSADQIRSAVMLQDCVIVRNEETGTYSFSCRIQFYKYIKQKWAKSKLILANDFDVFGNRFVMHDPRQLLQVL